MPRHIEGWRHLFAAVLVLATGSGPVEERLRRAYWEHMRLLDPAQDLPEHLRAEFDEIMQQMAVLFPHPDARVPQKWQQATELAERIVRLYVTYIRK